MLSLVMGTYIRSITISVIREVEPSAVIDAGNCPHYINARVLGVAPIPSFLFVSCLFSGHSCRTSELYRHFMLTLCISLRYNSTQESICPFRFRASLVISTSDLHRRSSRFITFIGIFQEPPFETGLRSAIRDFRLQFGASPSHLP